MEEPQAGISVAATKKKRGRPKDRGYAYYEDSVVYRERAGRSLQNYVNAQAFIDLMYDMSKATKKHIYERLYFEYAAPAHINRETNCAPSRYQGVSEQIGRMYRAGRIDAQEAAILGGKALCLIQEEGLSSHEVEKRLRQYHKQLRLSEAATKKGTA